MRVFDGFDAISDEERGCRDYDHGIAFQCVAGLGILQRSQE